MKKGFTLVELLAVIIILAALLLIIIPIVDDTIDKAEEKSNLRWAENYLRAVELAINVDELDVPIGTYDIMKNGNLCIGTYDKSSNKCTGYQLEVEITNAPKSGFVTISNNLAIEYSLTLENDKIVSNIDTNTTNPSCFEYIDNYDYTINEEVCINAFSGNVPENNKDDVELICSGDKTYGDLITIANYLGYSVEQLESNGIISNVKKHDTVSITGYKCGGDSGTNRDVVIPSKIDNKTVTKIGFIAFATINPLTGETLNEGIIDSVVIPNTVTTIEYSAFYGNKLTSVELGDSLTYIADGAFGANNLTNVTIPNNVTYIGMGAFAQNQLTSVELGDSLTSIGPFAFGSNKLTNVTLPNSVTDIGMLAFSENQLTSVTIPNSVTTIDYRAFAFNKLNTVIIGNGIMSIGSDAFMEGTLEEKDTGITYGSNALENVYINRNSSDVEIGSSAFGWAEGYSEDVNLHWNSTGPTG